MKTSPEVHSRCLLDLEAVKDAQDFHPGIFSAVPFDKLRAGSAGLVCGVKS
jgi:hypothetical protein